MFQNYVGSLPRRNYIEGITPINWEDDEQIEAPIEQKSDLYKEQDDFNANIDALERGQNDFNKEKETPQLLINSILIFYIYLYLFESLYLTDQLTLIEIWPPLTIHVYLWASKNVQVQERGGVGDRVTKKKHILLLCGIPKDNQTAPNIFKYDGKISTC